MHNKTVNQIFCGFIALFFPINWSKEQNSFFVDLSEIVSAAYNPRKYFKELKIRTCDIYYQ